MPSKFVIPQSVRTSVTGIATPGGPNKEGAAGEGAPSEATSTGIHQYTNMEGPVVYSDTTPNGMVVEYCPDPRWYKVNGQEVPSVTTVLGVLDKPGLTHWGQKVGVQGVLTLHGRGEIWSEPDWLDVDNGTPTKLWQFDASGLAPEEVTTETVLALMKEHRLTVSYVRDKAGERGTTVHDAFEYWAKGNEFAFDPDFFTKEELGYVVGLEKFLEAAQPEPLAAEVMVGSAIHGFAGRYDIRLRLNEPREVAVHWTPKRGPKMEVIPAGTYLCDLKTSKSVYPTSHFRQLAAYEAASVEGGYEPTDGQYVILVGADGSYQFKKSTAEFEDFLAVLEVYESNLRIK